MKANFPLKKTEPEEIKVEEKPKEKEKPKDKLKERERTKEREKKKGKPKDRETIENNKKVISSEIFLFNLLINLGQPTFFN